jgi:N-acetylglucosamine malate deacetylase 2
MCWPELVPGGGNAIARDLWLLNPKEQPMTAISAPVSPMTPAVPAHGPLPEARRVLAVTARPGQESADLGGLVYAFRRAGASLGLLCLTRGEASPLNSACARLEAVRPWELQLAASVLGISWVAIASYPDGGLRRQPAAELAGRVRRAIRQHAPDLLLVPDPMGGGPDDTAVAAAAVAAARHAGVPVVARTWHGARGAWMVDLGGETATARAIQKSAAAAHESQSGALPRLTRRLDQLGGQEHLRWLVPPIPEHAPRASAHPSRGASADVPASVRPASLAAAKVSR